MKLSKLATIAFVAAALAAPLSQSAYAGGSISLNFTAQKKGNSEIASFCVWFLNPPAFV